MLKIILWICVVIIIGEMIGLMKRKSCNGKIVSAACVGILILAVTIPMAHVAVNSLSVGINIRTEQINQLEEINKIDPSEDTAEYIRSELEYLERMKRQAEQIRTFVL